MWNHVTLIVFKRVDHLITDNFLRRASYASHFYFDVSIMLYIAAICGAVVKI